MNRLLIIGTSLACLLNGSSCERGPETGPVAPLDGYVYYVDNEYFVGNELFEGAKVDAVIGSVTVKSTVTDPRGYYIFPDLPASTYQLVFSKQLYGTWKLFGVEHMGLDTTHIQDHVRMSRIVDDRISSVNEVKVLSDIYNATVYLSLQVDVSIEVVGETDDYKLAYYYNNKPDVSLNNYLYSGLSNRLDDLIGRDLFSAGQKVYGKVYLVHAAENGYYDCYLDEQVYPSVNPEGSALFEFALPQ